LDSIVAGRDGGVAGHAGQSVRVPEALPPIVPAGAGVRGVTGMGFFTDEVSLRHPRWVTSQPCGD
jgi:hypothetical protein